MNDPDFKHLRKEIAVDATDIACAEVMHTTNRYWWRLVGRRYDVMSWAPDGRNYHDFKEARNTKFTRKFPNNLRGGESWVADALLEKLSLILPGVTLFMTLYAAWSVMLHAITRETDVVIGSAVAHRNRKELEGLIGFFSNTLAIRADLSGDPEFGDFLHRVRTATLGAYDHQDLPFEKLVEELQPECNMSHAPIFQVMFVLQTNTTDAPCFEGLDLSYPDFEMGIAKFDLLMEIAESTACVESCALR